MESGRDTGRGFEARDVDVRRLLLISAGFLVILALVLGALHLAVAKLGPELRPPAQTAMPREGIPALQVRPVEDLAALRAREAERLSSYGWIDRERGIAHIPVERAMSVVVEQGLPRWPPAPAQQQGLPPWVRSPGEEAP